MINDKLKFVRRACVACNSHRLIPTIEKFFRSSSNKKMRTQVVRSIKEPRAVFKDQLTFQDRRKTIGRCNFKSVINKQIYCFFPFNKLKYTEVHFRKHYQARSRILHRTDYFYDIFWYNKM